jgi:hypothetical protein
MNLVEWAFGKRMTPAERLRKHQRALEKTQRELDRERVKLENQEKKLVADIKKGRWALCAYKQRISCGHGGTSRSSTRCGHSYRQYRCGYRWDCRGIFKY